jgi:cyclic pyranopterin monophosphate synthase
MPNPLTHFQNGRPQMVDVSEKTPSLRVARAEGYVKLTPEALEALESNPKGDPLAVAQLAGIMGAKQTANLIPLCHPLLLSHVDVTLERVNSSIRIEATVKTREATGVEMEALTAVTVAALSVYDMLKASSKALEISGVRLLHKSGGKSGAYDVESVLPG